MPAYKDKARGTWYASFYYTNWKNEKKLKKKRGFRTKKEALAWEAEFLRSQAQSCDMTFGSMVEIYFEDMAGRLRDTTIATKRQVMNSRILPTFEGIPIDQITVGMVRKWQAELLQKGYADTYLRSIHSQFSAVMNYAVKYYGLRENPARIAGSIGADHADEKRFWEPEQFALVLSHVKKEQGRVGLYTLFWTGLRIGELLALTPADLDFNAKTLSVSKSLKRVNGQYVIGPPKTKKSKRVIPMPDKLSERLRKYVGSLYEVGEHDRIFPGTKNFFHSQMRSACKRAGVEKIRLHDLRHSHASMLINSGAPILLVSERLGHDDIETTLQTYGHLYSSTNMAAVEKLNELMGDE